MVIYDFCLYKKYTDIFDVILSNFLNLYFLFKVFVRTFKLGRKPYFVGNGIRTLQKLTV